MHFAQRQATIVLLHWTQHRRDYGKGSMESAGDIRTMFGQRVRHYRQRRGWQLDDLGKRVKMSRSSVSRIERGLQNLTMVDIEAIAKALEVAADKLFQRGSDGEVEPSLGPDGQKEGHTQRHYTTTYCLRYPLDTDASIPGAQSLYSKTISGLSWLAATIYASRYSRVDVSVYAVASSSPLRLLVASSLAC